jgi:hypothetical protein
LPEAAAAGKSMEAAAAGKSVEAGAWGAGGLDPSPWADEQGGISATGRSRGGGGKPLGRSGRKGIGERDRTHAASGQRRLGLGFVCWMRFYTTTVKIETVQICRG